ncbi:MAG: hypothetical protein JW869_03275 [Candidatus Omnitrophica bacterium]|nr:hypothetical protein [Candidatus Omnitrophota bacterium]
MKNAWVAVLLLSMCLVAGEAMCQEAEGEQNMSFAQLADILVRTLGIEMPEGSDELADAELFEVQANMLTEAGVTIFADSKLDEIVNRCDLADVLYDAIMGPNEASVEEKLEYLMQNDYMSSEGGYNCDTMSNDDIIALLNIPELSAAVAEAYSPVTIGALGAEGVNLVAPAPKNPEGQRRPRRETAGSPTS